MDLDGLVKADLESRGYRDERPVSLPSRRQVVKSAAAAIGGVAATAYVQPRLHRLGVPAALAVSGTPSFPTRLEVANVSAALGVASVMLTSKVTSIPSPTPIHVTSGNVIFRVEGVGMVVSGAVSRDVALVRYSLPSKLAKGTYRIYARYTGDTTFGPSAGTSQLTID